MLEDDCHIGYQTIQALQEAHGTTAQNCRQSIPPTQETKSVDCSVRLSINSIIRMKNDLFDVLQSQERKTTPKHDSNFDHYIIGISALAVLTSKCMVRHGHSRVAVRIIIELKAVTWTLVHNSPCQWMEHICGNAAQ